MSRLANFVPVHQGEILPRRVLASADHAVVNKYERQALNAFTFPITVAPVRLP